MASPRQKLEGVGAGTGEKREVSPPFPGQGSAAWDASGDPSSRKGFSFLHFPASPEMVPPAPGYPAPKAMPRDQSCCLWLTCFTFLGRRVPGTASHSAQSPEPSIRVRMELCLHLLTWPYWAT